MKSKKIILGCAVVGAMCCFGGLTACSDPKPAPIVEPEPAEVVYTPTLGFTPATHATDSYIKIDGAIDEQVYTAEGKRWYKGLKVDGEERATVDMTTVFGDSGIYVAYDVTELTNRIYYNPNRSSWLNSGVEMYFALGGTTTIDSPQAFEVDMVCSGELNFKRRFMDNWVDAATTYDITPVYAAKTKGGNYNERVCTGYTGELFIPYDYLEAIGVTDKGVKPQEVYINPVLITSYSYEGTLRSDRNWHNLAAADTDGDGWANPSTFLHFDKDGLVAHDIKVDIEGKGEIFTDKGYDFAIADNSLTLNVSADNGYTLDALTINNVNYKDKIVFKDYKAQIYIPSATEDLNIKATFKLLPSEQRLVSGNIVPDGVAASAGISDMRVKYFDGFNFYDLRTVNGAFMGYIPEGEHELVVVSARDGYTVTRRDVTVNANTPAINITVDDSMYGDKRAIRFDGIALAGGSRTVEIGNPVTASKFVFKFRLGVGMDGAAFPADKYVENFRLMADNGDYMCFQLVRWGGNFSTKVFTRGHEDQDMGGIGEALTAAAVQNNYLDFVLVRNGRNVDAYAYDLSGALVKLGSVSLYETMSDTQINSYSLESAEGVTPEVGVKVSDCVIYQGTTDLAVLTTNN